MYSERRSKICAGISTTITIQRDECAWRHFTYFISLSFVVYSFVLQMQTNFVRLHVNHLFIWKIVERWTASNRLVANNFVVYRKNSSGDSPSIKTISKQMVCFKDNSMRQANQIERTACLTLLCVVLGNSSHISFIHRARCRRKLIFDSIFTTLTPLTTVDSNQNIYVSCVRA